MRYVAPEFLPTLNGEGIHSFDDLWALERNWFEELNSRRGGTSGVCRKAWLNPAGGEPETVFVKFQENYCCRTWNHPLHGIPTACREARNLLKLNGKGFPTPRLLYYEERRGEERRPSHRAILITRELDGQSLYDYLKTSSLDSALAARIAELIFRLNRQFDYEHRALYPKHVWIGDAGLSLLDLEDARPRWYSCSSPYRDLFMLLRALRKKAKVPKADCHEILGHYLRLAGRTSDLDRLASRFGLR